MNSKELAQTLNNREHGSELTKAEVTEAKEAGLVVLYGYSDDNMEFEGAIREEVGCYDGGFALVDKASGKVRPVRAQHIEWGTDKKKVLIEAVWNTEGFNWVYKTDIPHETFVIMESGEKYCRGIVFSLDGVGKVAKLRGMYTGL